MNRSQNAVWGLDTWGSVCPSSAEGAILGDISSPTVKYRKYPSLASYSAGDSSYAAYRGQYYSNLFIIHYVCCTYMCAVQNDFNDSNYPRCETISRAAANRMTNACGAIAVNRKKTATKMKIYETYDPVRTSVRSLACNADKYVIRHDKRGTALLDGF